MTFKRTRCPHCKGKLEPGQRIHPDCIEPWSDEQEAKSIRKAEKQARLAARVEKAKDRQLRESQKKLYQLIAEAQKEFNTFIRLRDADKGCFVCGEPFQAQQHGGSYDAGHVRSRGAAGHLRFNEDNCHGECKRCNSPMGAKPHQIEEGAIRRIGHARYEALRTNNTPRQWDKDEVRGIRDHYRAKVKEMRNG